ncbi:hypothetical protein KA005_12960, partial [bacterium]|nr:hypothetical protein [bacterium]
MAYAKLMSKQFYYYNIASQFALKAVSPDKCPTMGVAHVDGQHWLVYNPDFIKYYNFNEISVILEHEICHFTYDHVKHFDSNKHSTKGVFKDEKEAADHVREKKEEAFIHRLKNIATDRSINVYLYGLPNIKSSIADAKAEFTDKEGNFNQAEYTTKMTELIDKKKQWFEDSTVTLATAQDTDILESNCITESSFKEILTEAGYTGDVEAVEKYATWKYYFDLLMGCPKTEEAIKDIKDMDVHFGDGDGDENAAQQGRDRIMMDAARNSNKHDIPGDLRAQLKELFDKYSKEKPLPWHMILRRMVNSAMKSIVENDISTRNRYYGNNHQIIPGYRNIPIKDIAVIWDVSGSCMDDETQTRFINECNMMIKSGSQVRVYYTDQDVEHVQDCKDKMMQPGKYEITGGGGTHLDNGVKRAIQDGYR